MEYLCQILNNSTEDANDGKCVASSNKKLPSHKMPFTWSFHPNFHFLFGNKVKTRKNVESLRRKEHFSEIYRVGSALSFCHNRHHIFEEILSKNRVESKSWILHFDEINRIRSVGQLQTPCWWSTFPGRLNSVLFAVISQEMWPRYRVRDIRSTWVVFYPGKEIILLNVVTLENL